MVKYEALLFFMWNKWFKTFLHGIKKWFNTCQVENESEFGDEMDLWDAHGHVGMTG